MDPKDIKEIKAIIDLMKKHDLSVFEIEKEGFRLKLQRGDSASQPATTAPAAAGGPAKGAAAAASEPPPPAAKAIESVPMNEIKAETSGVIAEVLADNGKPVQFGQALFRVR